MISSKKKLASAIVGINGIVLIVLSFFSYQCFAGSAMCFASPMAARQQLLQQGFRGAHSNNPKRTGFNPSAMLPVDEPSANDESLPNSTVANQSNQASSNLNRQTVHYQFDQNNHVVTTVQSPEIKPVANNAGLININQADANMLSQGLVGIGTTKAQAIVMYRNTHGKFNSVDELMQVKGIGAAILEKNKHKISLD